MRAIIIMEPGDVDVLALKEIPEPNPDRGQVRIRVRAIGVNRADLYRRRGMFPAPRQGKHDVPGLEFAGEVEALGPGADALTVGDRVMGIANGGTYAELVTVPASHTIKIPDSFTFESAAAVPEAFLTASDAITRLTIVANDWVVLTAVGSGVGTAALQLVKLRGAKCIGVSRSESKLARAAELGVDVGIHPFPLKFANEVRRITNGGATAAIDLVGGTFFPEILHGMRTQGRVMLLGLAGGRGTTMDLGVIVENRLRLEGTALRNRSLAERARLISHFNQTIMPAFLDGQLKPVIDRVFDIEEIREAHRYVEANANFGKVVVRVA